MKLARIIIASSLVLLLAPFGLDCDGQISRNVSNSYGRIGRVDGLPTMPARVKSVNAQILGVDGELIGLDHWQYFDLRERSLAQVVGVKWAQPNQTVHTVF